MTKTIDYDLCSPLQFVKGVGPARAALLKRLNIHNVQDLLYYQPLRYEKKPTQCNIRDLKLDHTQIVCGKVVSVQVVNPSRQRQGRRKPLNIFEAQITDHTGWLRAVWFNQPYLKESIKPGTRIMLTGQPKKAFIGLIPQMTNPAFEIIQEDDTISSGLNDEGSLPVYSLTEGLDQRRLRTIIRNALDSYAPYIVDPIPKHILQAHQLPSLKESLLAIHLPPSESSLEDLNEAITPYQRRIAFDEVFILQIGLCILKGRSASEKGISMKGSGELRKALLNNLPFSLTRAQERVIKEIISDMESESPMSRLLQGDVGCGKTIVALICMLNALESGHQAALMAPTELLAEQHYQGIKKLLGNMDIKVSLYTGSKRDKKPLRILKKESMIAVGTHALIQEDVAFESLGLSIIDEQHRFGVMQRASLRKKGNNPDVLIMSATPIPRTLAMTLYGDLDYSVIDELPPGRTPVQTRLFTEGNKREIYGILQREISKGRQAYIVYPVIEESENADLKSAILGAQRLPEIMPGLSVGLVHGRMKQEDRERVMRDFKEGRIHILVATTVIEVGVDVPNATVMVIINAERFGLAQLHQLRGRVGRGNYESYCLLLCYNQPEDARKRMYAMLKTNDGFKIAEEDLKIRGYGDLMGTRQSGMPELKTVNLLRDGLLVDLARREAESLLKEDPTLQRYPLLKKTAQQFWGSRIDLFKTA